MMRCLFVFALSLSFINPVSAQSLAEKIWDLDAQKAVPEFRWVDQTRSIHELIYSGEIVEGHATEVFAFYASPKTLGEAKEGPFPGVVLIHGGGGTAFAEWVNLWAKRGYAAIAMDLSGSRPPSPLVDEAGNFLKENREKRTKLEKGGLGHTHVEKFQCVGDGDRSNDWPYQTVASVMRAHSLLRSLPEVDEDRTAVTGISWGGYSTCLVASIDDRFKAAVPVYGCGFLHEGESVQKPSIDGLEPEQRAEWIAHYDPSAHLVSCKVPILFVNGTHDKHYVLDSYMKSFDAVPTTEKNIRVELKMRHGHQPGWAPEEIGLFIDSYCRKGDPLPTVSLPVSASGTIVSTYKAALPLTKAEFLYTTDTGLRTERKWQTTPATIGNGKVSAPAPPEEANTYYFSVTDDRGALVSSPVIVE